MIRIVAKSTSVKRRRKVVRKVPFVVRRAKLMCSNLRISSSPASSLTSRRLKDIAEPERVLSWLALAYWVGVQIPNLNILRLCGWSQRKRAAAIRQQESCHSFSDD